MILPIVHENELGIVAVNVIFGPEPLQVEAVAKLVITGAGLTVTTIVDGVPVQAPDMEVGVTI